MRFSEKLLQGSGIKVVTVDLSEIFSAADAVAEAFGKYLGWEVYNHRS